MRVAFFSPLPPARTGIADYSAALLSPLSRIAEVDTFTSKPPRFQPSNYDACVYQLGNNPHHVFAYEAALEWPGVIVLHEANLHHLIAELTIRRGAWDEYLREIELNAGPEALAYARRHVATLERGPQYDIPLLRTVLSRSRGAIVHSDAAADVVRELGFTGPLGKIPHGAWIVNADRMAYRERLGLNERIPLIGIFGFLKPYKRIAESLRAFRRLIRLNPEVRMILVGEAHPEMRLDSLIVSMNLSAHARHLDFAPIEDFNGYMAACDIVLNLRYPTVGESSGTLLRALGMGKAVIVSDVGSFREYSDEICLKAPIDASEEQHLFEYLNLLVARPQIALALGAKARAWVERECNWDSVARRYLDFLKGGTVELAKTCSINGLETVEAIPLPTRYPEVAEAIAPEAITSWAPVEDGSRAYVESHITRLQRTLALTPPANPGDRVLEMGAYLQITPALKSQLGYSEVRGCYFGPAGRIDRRRVSSESGDEFECEIDLFDAEKDCFPYHDGYFATVLCCELLEHLTADPIHMMSEINRVLRNGGHLVLTTPNVVSLRALAGILQGFHPQLFSAYIRPRNGVVDPRHAREYTPGEVRQLLEASGFEVAHLETGPFRDDPKPEFGWVEHLLERYILTKENRGDGIYALGRKTGPVRDRYPDWLYS